MKTIVFDTNILHDVYWFTQPKWQLILSVIELLPYELSIPRVVYDEILAHYKKSLESKIQNYNKSLKDINNIVQKSNQINQITIDIDVNYNEYKRAFDAISYHPKIEIQDYPNVNHQDIIDRAILRRKPFKPNGSGYRDTLIWESVKNLLNENKEIIFITNNSKDFLDESKIDIDKDLKDELTDNLSITVYKNLEEFEEKELKSQYKQLDDLIEQIKQGTQNGLTSDDLLFELRESMTDQTIDYRFEDSNDGQASVTYIEELNINDVISAVMLDENRIFILLECSVDLEANYFVDKIDIYTNDDASYGIEELDWNDYVSLVSKEAQIDVKVDLIFQRDTEDITEVKYFIDE